MNLPAGNRYGVGVWLGIVVGMWVAWGCQSPIVRMPEPMPDIVKEYKSLVVQADHPALKHSGVHVEAGQPLSVLVAGKVKVNERRRATIWHGPYTKLSMWIGNKIVTATGYETFDAPFSGELRFGVRDGGDFDTRTGKAHQPRNYADNQGHFQIDIIVWRTSDFGQIARFLKAQLAAGREGHEMRMAYNYLRQYEKIDSARNEATLEIEETRQQLDQLIATDRQRPAAVPPSESQSRRLADLETRLEQLTQTVATLDEMKAQLAAERRKSARLSRQLEEKAAREQNLLQQIQARAERPAALLISSPRNGHQTEAANVVLAGVAEDDLGVAQVRIFVNERLIHKQDTRGIAVAQTPAPKRLFLNERLPLFDPENRIRVEVRNTAGLLTTKAIVVQKIEKRGNVWAMIVGINEYPHVPKLKYAVNDALAFYEVLTRVNRIPEENITLLLDDKATLNNLRSALGTKLKSRAGRDDMVIIYFAGHGATEPDTMSPDGDGLEKYLLPYNADLKDLYASALPTREISHIFRRIRSDRLVFIADACYSGASGGRTVSLSGTRASISDAFLARMSSGKGTVVLSASGPNEVSVEKDALQHGVFTYYLIEALEGRADRNDDGLVTTDEVYDYVSTKVTLATNQEQHPIKKGAVEGSLVVGVLPRPD
jgi:hypothetical protein